MKWRVSNQNMVEIIISSLWDGHVVGWILYYICPRYRGYVWCPIHFVWVWSLPLQWSLSLQTFFPAYNLISIENSFKSSLASFLLKSGRRWPMKLYVLTLQLSAQQKETNQSYCLDIINWGWQKVGLLENNWVSLLRVLPTCEAGC